MKKSSLLKIVCAILIAAGAIFTPVTSTTIAGFNPVPAAILGLDENKGLSALDAAVNPLDPFKPRIAAASETLQLNLLYVHGVQNDDAGRINAANSLAGLKNSIDADISYWISRYQQYSHVTINYASAAANLYTAEPSPYHPTDSLGPMHMDDWEVGDPGCATTKQGDPCTTAFEWRYRLAREINRLFPPTAKNIILIGHSTGARVAFEVATDTGPAGVNTYAWGVRSKIRGVVSIQGMIDGLQSNKYDVVGPNDFVTTCKNGDPIARFGGPAAPGNGWCEYAGNISGVAAANWFTKSTCKRALGLVSRGSCSPALWTGESDGSLPFAAQASPYLLGLNMTPAGGETYTVAYGQTYGGSYCHTAITNASDPNHATAVTNAKAKVLEMLFTQAYRVPQVGTQATEAPVPFGGWSTHYPVISGCGYCSISGCGSCNSDIPFTPRLQVVGVCKHPGLFDGGDHPIQQELSVFDLQSPISGEECSGSYQWRQVHDPNNSHNATFFWQVRSAARLGPYLAEMSPD